MLEVIVLEIQANVITVSKINFYKCTYPQSNT